MKTNAQIFAERGDPWDSRIPLTFGQDREPPRYKTRIHPDGFVERTPIEDHHWQWDQGGSPRQAQPRRAFHEKCVAEEVLEAGREARRQCNARFKTHRAPLFRSR